MTLRELLMSAIEHGYLDEPVIVYAWNSDAQYVDFEVTGFRSGMPNGKPRQEVEIRQRHV